MKRILFIVLAAAALLCLPFLMAGDRTVEAANPAASSCKACHADFASVLPKAHPPVKGTELAACTACHAPDLSGKKEKNAYSTRMHKAHIAPKGSLDCTACHAWEQGKSFGLIGGKGSWGAPTKEDLDLVKEIFASWAVSGHTDTLHAKAGIVCSQCHGREFPKADGTVENAGCLKCHGPMEKLALKTEPKDFKDRNPHKSHLGEIACTVCHKGHGASQVYCLSCHPKFQMKIQGAAKP